MQYFLNYSFSIQQYYGKVVENFITKNFPIVLLYQLSLVSEIFVQYVCIYTNLQNLYIEVVDNYISRNFPLALLFQFSIFQILNDIVGTAVSKEKVDRTVKQHLRSSMAVFALPKSCFPNHAFHQFVKHIPFQHCYVYGAPLVQW